MEGLAGSQGNKYGGVGVAGCRELRRKGAAAGQALPLNRGTLALAAGHRRPGARAPHSGTWKGRLLSWTEGRGGECVLPEPAPVLGWGETKRPESGPWPWLLEPLRQEGESQPMPVGSGQRPLPGALNARLSPSPNRESLSPPIIQIGGGLCLLSSGFQTLPPPPPLH